LTVGLVAVRAKIGIDPLAAHFVRRQGRIGNREKSHSGDADALWRPLAQELDIGDQGLHLGTVVRQRLAVHAAHHASVDAPPGVITWSSTSIGKVAKVDMKGPRKASDPH
jgi:hypothetical protein